MEDRTMIDMPRLIAELYDDYTPDTDGEFDAKDIIEACVNRAEARLAEIDAAGYAELQQVAFRDNLWRIAKETDRNHTQSTTKSLRRRNDSGQKMLLDTKAKIALGQNRRILLGGVGIREYNIIVGIKAKHVDDASRALTRTIATFQPYLGFFENGMRVAEIQEEGLVSPDELFDDEIDG
jgi:hypothetical protein